MCIKLEIGFRTKTARIDKSFAIFLFVDANIWNLNVFFFFLHILMGDWEIPHFSVDIED